MNKELNAALQGLLRNPDFRLFLRFIYEQGNMAGNPFTTNALSMSFTCGKLALAQEVFGLLQTANPAAYPDLMKEMTVDRRTAAATD